MRSKLSVNVHERDDDEEEKETTFEASSNGAKNEKYLRSESKKEK